MCGEQERIDTRGRSCQRGDADRRDARASSRLGMTRIGVILSLHCGHLSSTSSSKHSLAEISPVPCQPQYPHHQVRVSQSENTSGQTSAVWRRDLSVGLWSLVKDVEENRPLKPCPPTRGRPATFENQGTIDLRAEQNKE